MWCTKCGSQIQENEKFCRKCGSPVQLPEQPVETAPVDQDSQPETEQPQAEQTQAEQTLAIDPQQTTGVQQYGQEAESAAPAKKNMMPVIIGAAAVLVVLILAIVIVSSLFSIPSVMVMSGSIKMVNADGELVVMGDNSPKYKLNAASSNTQFSMDGKTGAVLLDASPEDGGELYVITAKGKEKVSDGVFGYIMADSGNGIAYFKDFDSSARSAVLYLYDRGSKKSTKVDSDVYFDFNSAFVGCISPDGKSVGYITEFDQDDLEFTGNVKTSGKNPEKLEENALPLAISNNGSHIYYAIYKSDNGSTDTVFYVKKGDQETKLASTDSSGSLYFFFNSDYSQMIFNYDGKSYITKNGGEKVKISSKGVTGILAPGTAQRRYQYSIIGNIYTIGFKDLSNIVLVMSDNSLAYLNSKAEVDSIVSEYKGGLYVSKDGKKVYFISSGSNLYKKTLGNDSDKESIADDVVSFVISPDGSKIYYVNDEEELYYISGSSKPKKVADDVSGSIAISGDGSTVYFLADYKDYSGTLYSSRDGGKKTMINDEAYSVETTINSVYYYSNYDSANGTYDVYRSDNGSKFTQMVSEAGGN